MVENIQGLTLCESLEILYEKVLEELNVMMLNDFSDRTNEDYLNDLAKQLSEALKRERCGNDNNGNV